jgi:hypothetical protein
LKAKTPGTADSRLLAGHSWPGAKLRGKFIEAKLDLTAKTPKMKKPGLNIKLLFVDFLEKWTFRS